MADEPTDNKQAEQAEALRALADGEHDEPAEPRDRHDDAPAFGTDEDPAAGQGPVDHPPADSPEMPVLSRTAAARQQRAAGATRRGQHHVGRQFRAAMIPLMLATAGLLVVLATLVLAKGTGGAGTLAGRLFGQGATPYLVLGAYPLAALLVLGAWLFHRELTRR